MSSRSQEAAVRAVESSWHKVTLPLRETGIGGKVASLQDAFDAAFMANLFPEDAAMFGNRDKEPKNYSCYFSPGAVRIAQDLIAAYTGVACPPPLKAGLTLRIGHVRAIDTLL
jgi:hypothetical protein